MPYQVVFIFQVAPTPDDTYNAFVFSRDLSLPPGLEATPNLTLA